MSIEPESIEPRPDDELSVVSDIFSSADPDRSGIESSAPELGAAMFYTQGGSPC